jgi:hypothetical protein
MQQKVQYGRRSYSNGRRLTKTVSVLSRDREKQRHVLKNSRFSGGITLFNKHISEDTGDNIDLEMRKS